MVVNSQQVTDDRTGLSLEDKRRFVLSTLPIMAGHTFPYVCSVLGVVDRSTGRHYGSALRCVLKGRRAILTALHVIEEAQGEPGGLAIATGYGCKPYVVHGEVNIDRSADIAVYFLPDDFPFGGLDFWPAERIDRELDKISTDYLFLHGFPGSQSYSSQFLTGVLNKSLPYGAMRRIENLPADLQPYQFAIEYDPVGMSDETGAAKDLVDPHGLSGSPVWRIGASGRKVRDWTADDCLFVGVVTQWRPTEKVLVATSTYEFPPNW
jgi:hypothetical protein